VLLTVGLLAINVVAAMHARAMTHFVADGGRTLPPERLTIGGKARVLLTGVRVPRPMNRATPAGFNLPFVTHTTTAADGTALEAWAVPEPTPSTRPAVVMFHGYGTAKASLLPSARTLHDLGHPVLLIDFRGSGGSAGDVTTVGYREADDVAAAAALARQLWPGRPLALYGQSMGAAAVLRAVGTGLTTADAVIVESPFDSLLNTAANRFRAMRLPATPLAHLLVFWGGAGQGYWAFAHNPADYAAGVRCPALLLHGAKDPRVTPAQARAVFDRLAGPKQFQSFPTGGHLALAEHDPAAWSRTVRTFLEPVK
jgi:hypothetical protein